MRTAILMSGKPRECNAQSWQSQIDNLLSVLPNPDIYIYTSEPFDKHFLNQVKPRAYVIEQQKTFSELERFVKDIGYYDNAHVNSYVQQVYGVKRVWELKQEKYDIIVRTRPDYMWLRPIPFSMFDLTKISTLHNETAPTLTTEFAIGPERDMEIYCNIFDWLIKDGKKYLTDDNPRLQYADTIKIQYTCDVIMATYLLDVMGIQLAKQNLPPDHPSPYCYYRIMYRANRDCYQYEDEWCAYYVKNPRT